MHRFSVLLFLLLTIPPLAAQKGERHFEYGFEVRVRNEDWNNIFDFKDSADDERGQIRYRHAPLDEDTADFQH